MAKYNLTRAKENNANYQTLVNPKLMDELRQKILEIILIQKKYKDKHYSAKNLAEDLGTNTRYISAVVSVRFHMNYTSFVNKFRIDEAMAILTDRRYKNLKMEDVAQMVGFANRQSFYAAFFKINACTPRDYRNRFTQSNSMNNQHKNKDFKYTDERFADIQMLRYRVKGFEKLSVKQKIYIYYLAQATLWGRDITFDQFGRYNISIRKMLECIYVNYKGSRRSKAFKALEIYLKRIWFSNGIYHHYGCEKFAPGFTQEYLNEVIESLNIKLFDNEEQRKEIYRAIFDPEFMPKRVNQTDGEDLIKTSACNFYQNVTQCEVEQYYNAQKSTTNEDCLPSFGLNSKLVKENGIIKELKYTASGLYGNAIKEIIYWLENAAKVTENVQQCKIIKILIEYYKSGDLSIFDHYSIEWIKEQDGLVDFINGFIEVYGDPLGLKGSWEGIVEYRNTIATKRTQTISKNAQWFEDHSPIAPQFRKQQVKGVTANVVCAAMLGGDEYPASAIGINLPNAEWIRAKHGSKSVTIGNLTEAYNKASQGNGFLEEFVGDPYILKLINKYGEFCDNLHTDLHECLGHGSGQLLPGVTSDDLKAYGSTIEEARADLFGLYYLPDIKLIELGLIPNEEAYEAQYYTYLMNGLMTQLVRITPGNIIEEAHMRNRALIARWVLDNGDGCIHLENRDNKTYLVINDYKVLRKSFGKLLYEIQRIKSEGDYEAARTLIEQYAINIDPKLHEEILNRYSKLKIAPYKGFINPRLIPIYDTNQQIVDVKIDYTEGYAQQMLRYSKEYGCL